MTQNGSRILAQWNAQRAMARRPVVSVVRGFDAAKDDHLTAGWKATNNSIDADARAQLDKLRMRSRDLSHNNDYMRKFLRMVAVNVVGPNGFIFKSLAREYLPSGQVQVDAAARDVVERHFAMWCKPRGGADVTKHTSLQGLLKLAIKAAARDGEYLIRKIRGDDARNPYKFALQILDIDRLDTQRNGVFQGNEVVMGVEIDTIGQPVAYHLLASHPGALTYALNRGQRYERVPAEDIFHGFIADRPEQRRGLPWAHTAMLRLEMLGKFQTAALVASRKGAETVGVLQRTLDADIPAPGSSPIGAVDPATGQAYETSLPGTWDTLPAGYTMQAYESRYPDQVFGQFVKDALRGVASGLGVAYNGLGNDMEGVNFSSIRAGVIEERECWIELQNWLIEQLVTPIFTEWLGMALLAGALKFPNGSALPATKLDKFAEHQFLGRRWQWVDPEKDGQANERAVKNGWKTNEQVAAEQGFDFFDNVEAIQQEQTWAADHDVQLGDPAPAPPAAPAVDPAAKLFELVSDGIRMFNEAEGKRADSLAGVCSALSEQSRALLERPISVTVPVQMHEHHHHQRLKRKVPVIDGKGRIAEFREEWIEPAALPAPTTPQ